MAPKRRLQPICLALASLFWLGGPAQAEIGRLAPLPGNAVPAVVIDGEAGPFTLHGAKGKVILLDFWATWCSPCVAEMPKLDALQAEYGPRGLLVVAASQDMTGKLTVKTFYRQHRIAHLGLYLDKEMAAFRAFSLRALPTAFLIGRDGKMIAGVEGGYDWSSKEAKAMIEKALAAAP